MSRLGKLVDMDNRDAFGPLLMFGKHYKAGRVGGGRKDSPPLVEPEMQISHVRLS